MNDKVKDILAKLKKNNGADSVQLLGDTVGVQGIQRISTGCYSLDKAMGGGVPVGRIIEIFGPESSGKSTLCLEIIAQFQKQGKIVGYIDTEFSFDPMYAKALGVDLDSIILAQPNSGEEAFNIALDMIENGVDLLIMDSVAAIVPLAEQEGSMEDQQMGAQARLIGKGLRKITGPVAKHNATFLVTNQLRSKIGVMFGNPQCVTLDTMVQVNNSSLQIKELFQFVGLNVENIEKNVFYDISDKQIEIKSYNHSDNQVEFKKILSLVRKDDAKIVKLVTKSGDILLKCSQAHRIWNEQSKQYVSVGDIQSGILLTNTCDTVQFFVEKTNQIQPIVDMQVQGNENYFTNGVLSHNTTPGGRALPYFCSVRISLNGGSAGEKNSDGERITKVVKATIVKNKTYPPFKTAEFSIKFGTGIDKVESLVQGAIDNGIFEKTGAWIKLYGESFCQGIESLKTKLVEMDVIDDITQALNQIMLNNKTAQDVKDIVMRNIVLETKEKVTPKKASKTKVEDSQQVISEQV